MPIELGTLQHERGHSKVDAWRKHWKSLKSEQTKVNFLVMLKGRRDNFDELDASVALNELALLWISEKYAA